MAARRGSGLALVAVLVALLCPAEAAVRELKVGYYAETCPEAEGIVREVMARALAREARSVASVMRLQFHDCFVNVSRRLLYPTHLISPSIALPSRRGLFFLRDRSDEMMMMMN
jgi:hypothetical protein